jgi:hypothetical protein
MGVRRLVWIVPGLALAAAVLGFAPQAGAAGSGAFDPTGPMSTPRAGAVAAPLPGGRVLVAGGVSELGVAPHGCEMDRYSAEVYDPVTGTFSGAGIGSMSVPRVGAVAAPLPDGRVLVAGGGYCVVSQPYGMPTGIDLPSAEIFNPATNTFSTTGIGSMSVPRSGASAAPLPDGRVLVAGGSDGPQCLSSAEVFDPATNTFSSAGIGSMSVPRCGAVAAPLPGGRILMAGGNAAFNAFHDLSSAEVFDPATNTFSTTGIGSMSVPRDGASAASLPDGRVLVAGGFSTAAYLSSAEVFDPATNTFSAAGIGSMSVGRHGASAASLPDGRVLVTGGFSGAYLSSAEVFSQVSCRGRPATIIGSGGADHISGTRRADVIIGAGGDDTISGLNGNDVICGGEGNDGVYGMKGSDKLSGNAGNDAVKGGPGDDLLKGGAGMDRLHGGSGKDKLKGGPDKDEQVQ